MITEYDPNINFARHSIELTFMQWDYSLTMEVDVLGNCKGATLFDAAITTCFDEMYDQDDDDCVVTLKRKSADGGVDELEVSVYEEDDLEAICVGIKIVMHIEEAK